MSNNSERMQQDIESLQVKLAYQEDTLEQLNQIVTSQQSQIQHLDKLTRSMLEKLKTIQTEENSISDGVEIPPHY